MSSVSKSCPQSHLVGDVGVLKDEEAQRLLSILGEAATGALSSLRRLAQQHPAAKFDKLFQAGISSIGTWNAEVVREEVQKMTASYPETHDLYRYTYLSLLSNINPELDRFYVPALEDFHMAFIRRVCENDDVRRGTFFFALPFAHKRVLFVECFRNALHDMMRKFSLASTDAGARRDRGGAVYHAPRAAERTPLCGAAPAQATTAGCAEERGGGDSAGASRPSHSGGRRAAPADARKSPPPAAATTLTRETLAEHSQTMTRDKRGRGTALARSMKEMDRTGEAARREPTVDRPRRIEAGGEPPGASACLKRRNASLSDVAAPSSVRSESKAIPLKAEPCFFSGGEDARRQGTVTRDDGDEHDEAEEGNDSPVVEAARAEGTSDSGGGEKQP
jgi:hypothetical protein